MERKRKVSKAPGSVCGPPVLTPGLTECRQRLPSSGKDPVLSRVHCQRAGGMPTEVNSDVEEGDPWDTRMRLWEGRGAVVRAQRLVGEAGVDS